MENQNKIPIWLGDNIFNILFLQFAGMQLRMHLGERIKWLQVPDKIPLYKIFFSYKTAVCTAALGVILAAIAGVFFTIVHGGTKILGDSLQNPNENLNKLDVKVIPKNNDIFYVPTKHNYTPNSIMAKIG